MKLLALLSALAIVGAAPARTAVPGFDHVVLIVFENKEVGSVVGSRNAPTFNAMARRYARLTRYYGVTHPSLPNYLALVSGSTQGIASDCTDCLVSAPSLADSLDDAGKTWKLYAEGLPYRGYLGASLGRYAKKHVPFLYFRSIVADRARRDRVVPMSELAGDLRTGSLPDFALLVPDACHSMHDCPVRAGDAWLRATLPPLLRVPGTVAFVVFDEGSTRLRGGGHVAALALGTAVRPGARFTRVTSHYGLLRTIETAWGLPLLGRSGQATAITGIWR